MDGKSHTTDTWTSDALIGPGWLSGQLAVHRQLLLYFGHNRYPCQSDGNFGIIQTYLICENIIHSWGGGVYQGVLDLRI